MSGLTSLATKVEIVSYYYRVKLWYVSIRKFNLSRIKLVSLCTLLALQGK